MALSPVHQAIAQVAAAIDPVVKERAPGLTYKIIPEAAVMAQVRPAMIAAELTMVPVGVDLLDLSTWDTRSGAKMNRTAVRVTYRITHFPSGDSVDTQTVGEAADSGDKSFAKCLTIAWKYAVRQVFLIPTGDDPDRKIVESVMPSVAAPAGVKSVMGAGGKDSSAATPSSSTHPRAVVAELENLIGSLDDPDAALQAILSKRGIATLGELSDDEAQLVRHKLMDKIGARFFDDKLTPASAKN